MWESWTTAPDFHRQSEFGFGPATRGPFPLYACSDAAITTASGVMVVCGRFPAGLTCQASFDSGMSWKGWTIDVSGGWAGGTFFEIAPDELIHVRDLMMPSRFAPACRHAKSTSVSTFCII